MVLRTNNPMRAEESRRPHQEPSRRVIAGKNMSMPEYIGCLTYWMRVTAPSIERALRIAGDGKPGRRVRLVFPIDSEAFFVPGDHARRAAA